MWKCVELEVLETISYIRQHKLWCPLFAVTIYIVQSINKIRTLSTSIQCTDTTTPRKAQILTIYYWIATAWVQIDLFGVRYQLRSYVVTQRCKFYVWTSQKQRETRKCAQLKKQIGQMPGSAPWRLLMLWSSAYVVSMLLVSARRRLASKPMTCVRIRDQVRLHMQHTFHTVTSIPDPSTSWSAYCLLCLLCISTIVVLWSRMVPTSTWNIRTQPIVLHIDVMFTGGTYLCFLRISLWVLARLFMRCWMLRSIVRVALLRLQYFSRHATTVHMAASSSARSLRTVCRSHPMTSEWKHLIQIRGM